MSYGNPDRQNKYEKEASALVHQLDGKLTGYFRDLGQYPGIFVESQTYYDSADNFIRLSTH